MPTKTQPPAQQVQIASGQTLLLWLAEGSELRNLTAPLTVQPRDALGSPPMHLGTGLGWRAPSDGWIHLHAPFGRASVQLNPAPAEFLQTQKNRPKLKGLGRLLGWRWLRSTH